MEYKASINNHDFQQNRQPIVKSQLWVIGVLILIEGNNDKLLQQFILHANYYLGSQFFLLLLVDDNKSLLITTHVLIPLTHSTSMLDCWLEIPLQVNFAVSIVTIWKALLTLSGKIWLVHYWVGNNVLFLKEFYRKQFWKCFFQSGKQSSFGPVYFLDIMWLKQKKLNY